MNGENKSPWLSVNDMLIQNKCWLCEEVFPRGTKKKVFQVSQLIDYYYKRAKAEHNDEAQPTIRCRNMRKCFANYINLLEGQDFDDLGKLHDELQRNDVEVWMSGLVCARNDICKSDINLILPDTTINTTLSSSHINTTSYGAIAIGGGVKDCPPGCGCDNPWPFLT